MMGDGERLESLAFPDRDPSLKGVIRRLSEPETGRAADNFVSNEDSYPRVAGELARRCPRNAVYLGVGPDQNFTMIAQARPRLAFVIDNRRRNLRLHLLHKSLTALSVDRAGYLRRLTAREPVRPLPSDPTAADLVAGFGPPPMDPKRLAAEIFEVRRTIEPLGILDEVEWADLATIQAKLAGPGLSARFLALPMYPTLAKLLTTNDRAGRPAHWLAQESTYQVVRDLQRTDRVVPLVGDFAGSTALQALGDWLRGRSLKVGVCYTSDVEFFLIRAMRFDRFIANLSSLPWADGALIVRSSTREIQHPDRVSGDSSTTTIAPVAPFLERAKTGKIRSVDDLFALGSSH